MNIFPPIDKINLDRITKRITFVLQNYFTMLVSDVKIGLEVVRSKGNYVVGRVGKVVAIDEPKEQIQVKWYENTTTWVSVKCIEPTSIPYEILPIDLTANPWERKPKWPRYRVKAVQKNTKIL